MACRAIGKNFAASLRVRFAREATSDPPLEPGRVCRNIAHENSAAKHAFSLAEALQGPRNKLATGAKIMGASRYTLGLFSRSDSQLTLRASRKSEPVPGRANAKFCSPARERPGASRASAADDQLRSKANTAPLGGRRKLICPVVSGHESFVSLLSWGAAATYQLAGRPAATPAPTGGTAFSTPRPDGKRTSRPKLILGF